MRVGAATLAALAAAGLAQAGDTGTLHLSSRPVTEVFIDGVAHGTTADTRSGIQLDAGTYSVRFLCSDAECEQFRLRSGKKTLVVAAGASVRYHADFFALNGRTASTSPSGTGSAPDGTDSAPDGTDSAPRGSSTDAPAPPFVSPAADQPGGRLFISATPNARVTIDGADAGTTAQLADGIRLTPGSHVLRFVCDAEPCADFSRRSGKKTIEIVDGQDQRYAVDFFALNGR